MENFKYEKLILENYEHNSSLELPEFLFNFFKILNYKYCTVYPGGNIQCFCGRRRSLGDITNICRTYYPNTDIFEVKEILLNFGEKLVGHYCRDINKRVYELKISYGPTSLWSQMGEGDVDEFGILIEYKTTNLYSKFFYNDRIT